MKTVFISYSSDDRLFAEKLSIDLKTLGLGVWFDRWEIKVGDSIVSKVDRGLTQNDYLIVVLSPNSVDSNWVKKEVFTILMSEIYSDKVKILPILYQECKIPTILIDKKYANFTKSYDRGLQELAQAIIPETSSASQNLNKQLSEFYVKEAIKYEECRDFDKAFTNYNKAIEVYPDGVNSYYHFGVFMLLTNNLNDARKLYEIVLSKVPNHVSALSNLGVIHLKEKRYDKAIECFERNIDNGANDYASYRQLGEVYIQTKQEGKSIKVLIKALKIAPTLEEYGVTSLLLGRAYGSIGQRGKAVVYFEEFVDMEDKLGRKKIENYVNIANELMALNLYDRAIEYVKRGILLSPGNEKIMALESKLNKEVKWWDNVGIKSHMNVEVGRYEYCKSHLLDDVDSYGGFASTQKVIGDKTIHLDFSARIENRKILFLASDPSDATRLRLGQELRDIREKLQMAQLREQFVLESREAVRPGDISQAIFDIEPHIIHFSGHGFPTGELCLEDTLGKVKPVKVEALAALFELISHQVSCVLLNACYSEMQAEAISCHIPYVIGMNQAIGDRAAISFSVGFYKALGAGRTVQQAYKFGCAEIQLQGIPEHLTPILKIRKEHEWPSACYNTN